MTLVSLAVRCISSYCTATFLTSDPHLDTMVYTLSKFVCIPSVSNSPHHKEDCRQAGIWLRKCLSQLGAQSYLVSLLSNEGHCMH